MYFYLYIFICAYVHANAHGVGGQSSLLGIFYSVHLIFSKGLIKLGACYFG